MKKEHPILFSASMVNAILNGSKSMTRRVVKCSSNHNLVALSNNSEFRGSSPYPLAEDKSGKYFYFRTDKTIIGVPCPYGQVGDRLWVRETHYLYGWWVKNGISKTGKQKYKFVYDKSYGVKYIDNPPEYICKKKTERGWFKRPSIFIPRWASRITLEITNIRVDKLVTLDYNDAIKEGFESVEQFKYLWDKINSKKENCLWQDNPWVWILEFRRV